MCGSCWPAPAAGTGACLTRPASPECCPRRCWCKRPPAQTHRKPPGRGWHVRWCWSCQSLHAQAQLAQRGQKGVALRYANASRSKSLACPTALLLAHPYLRGCVPQQACCWGVQHGQVYCLGQNTTWCTVASIKPTGRYTLLQTPYQASPVPGSSPALPSPAAALPLGGC